MNVCNSQINRNIDSRGALVPNRHQYFSDPAVSRLMGTVLALSGELFVAKAEIELLKRTLIARGIVTDDAFDLVNESSEMQGYLVAERTQYAQHLLEPIRQPDLSMEQHWALFGEGHDPDAVLEVAHGSVSTRADS
jgi:hypothetical protein